jgi:predicted nucleic acid-binding protein
MALARLIDTNLWIALTRTRSPQAMKDMITPIVQDPAACLAEPIVFEVLRSATEDEARRLTIHFQTLLLLASPGDLWVSGVELGRACRKTGFSPGSINLLIAVVALHHGAELVTFDDDFQKIAGVCDLKVKLLKSSMK